MLHYLDYFRARKGDLIRRPLTEKVKTCFHILKIQYNDAVFKKAKKVRDSLSHGSQVELQNLEEAELYIREIVRHMIRRDLEYAGIFLDGNIRKPEDFEELVPGFVRARQDMKEASFGPL